MTYNNLGERSFHSISFTGSGYEIEQSGSGNEITLNELNAEATAGIDVAIIAPDGATLTVDVDQGATLTLKRGLSGTGNLTKTGEGQLTISTLAGFTGEITLAGGTLKTDGDGLGDAARATVAQGAILDLGTTSALEKPVIINGGTVKAGPIDADVTFNAGRLEGSDINRAITVEGGGTLRASGNLTQPVTFEGAEEGTLEFAATGDRAIHEGISGPGRLVKTANGTLTLSGTNNFSGGIEVQQSGGVVQGAEPQSLGNPAGPVTVASGARLELPDGYTRTGPVSIAGAGGTNAPGPLAAPEPPEGGTSSITVSGPVTFTGATTFTPPAGVTVRLVGGIASTGDASTGDHLLTKNGEGTLVLGGERTRTGATTISAGGGVLRVESGAWQALDPGHTPGLITVNNNSTLEVTGGATLAEAVTLIRTANPATLVGGGGAAIVGNVTLTGGANDPPIPVVVPGGRLTIAGDIVPPANARGIEKLGGGTLAIDGDAHEDYERSITVKAGTLLANGELPNVPVVVPGDGAGTVGGSGTVKSVSFASGAGGGVRPGGTNPGTLTILEDATLATTASLTVDLAGAGATASAAQTNGDGNGDPPAAEHDVLKVNGTLTLGAARLVPRFSYTPSEGDTFVVAEAGTLSGTFGGLGEGSQLLADNHTLSVSYAGNKVTLTVLEVGEPTDDTVGKVTRLWGADRVETGIAVSDHAFPAAKGAEAVVLSRADLYPDALAGTPLAVKKGGPLLVTGPSALDPRVADELERVLDLGKTVYLLGGPAALAPEVEQAVADAGYVVVRLAGETRYETAIAIATDGLGDPDTILLATGVNFPDALAGAAAASAIDGAVLLSAGDDSHPATTAYLAERPGVTVYALGGPAARAYPSAIAVVGEDRYETATKTASELFDLELADVVGIATGTNFPDALTGGAHIGHPDRVGPLVLTHPQGLPPATSTWLAQHGPSLTRGYVYGGPVAVAAPVVDEIAGLMGDSEG